MGYKIIVRGEFQEKGPVSNLLWNNFFIFVDPKQISVGIRLLCPLGPSTYLLAYHFTFSLMGAWFILWGPYERYFKGALSASAADTADS